jgi:hypothetical protein
MVFFPLFAALFGLWTVMVLSGGLEAFDLTVQAFS